MENDVITNFKCELMRYCGKDIIGFRLTPNESNFIYELYIGDKNFKYHRMHLCSDTFLDHSIREITEKVIFYVRKNTFLVNAE